MRPTNRPLWGAFTLTAAPIWPPSPTRQASPPPPFPTRRSSDLGTMRSWNLAIDVLPISLAFREPASSSLTHAPVSWNSGIAAGRAIPSPTETTPVRCARRTGPFGERSRSLQLPYGPLLPPDRPHLPPLSLHDALPISGR